jgi:NADH dehydrogenase
MSNKPLVTVFGGSGFLGRHTVRALAKAGHRVRVAVRHAHGGYFLIPSGTVGQIQVVKCEVQDKDQVAAALVGADAVVNLTGIITQSGHNSFEGLHVEAAANIAAAARAAGIATLVHVSVLGADAQSPSRYACTKGEGEAKVRAAFPDATILRPSLTFGPEDRLFNKFASLARFVPALPLVGGGRTRFQPVFVGDVAAAVQRAVEDTGTRGKTYELGGPTVYSFEALMRVMLETIGRKRLLVKLPFFLASIKAFFLQMTKLVGVEPLLTPDQVTFLKTDHIVKPGALTLADLGIAPVALEAVIPSYLWRFRAKGQYEDVATSRVPAQR